MYIYTDRRQLVDPLHPSRARPGVTYARTRALLSWPGAHLCSSDRTCSMCSYACEGLFLFLIEGIYRHTVRHTIRYTVSHYSLHCLK